MCGICAGINILILDEPTNGLDIASVAEVKNIICNVFMKENRTVIVASHDLYFIEEVATKYIFMKNGCVGDYIEKKLQFSELQNVFYGVSLDEDRKVY